MLSKCAWIWSHPPEHGILSAVTSFKEDWCFLFQELPIATSFSEIFHPWFGPVQIIIASVSLGAMATPCPEDSIPQHSYPFSSSYILLHLLFHDVTWTLVGYLIQMSCLGLITQSSVLSTLTMSLCWLSPTAKRCFSGQGSEQPRSVGIQVFRWDFDSIVYQNNSIRFYLTVYDLWSHGFFTRFNHQAWNSLLCIRLQNQSESS